MCGICGFIDLKRELPEDDLVRVATRMAATLHHRGPDDGSAWADAGDGVALGFRRLAIIDLTPAGRQPMVSASGRSVICYNGEIYNAEELRRELGSAVANWRGHSDTEVMLEAIERWGIETAVRKFIGMFAFAFWETDRKRLWLVRDRLGIKPVYWSLQGSTFLFGSELRALAEHPSFVKAIDRDAAAAFLRHNYFPAPHTVFKNVQQLKPGHMLCLEPGSEPRISPYWSLADVVERGRASPFTGSEREATDALEELLGDAVRRRMIADVPLGAFLSGGYDSSTVVALMQKHSSRPVQTFTIGFTEDDYNEAQHAKAVAEHLGTDHTELYLTSREAQELIPRLPELYDEPFGDSSQIPTYLVSSLARQHVTVALSGDGGDELFAGYNRYAHADTFRRTVAYVPVSVRSAAATAMQSISPTSWDRVFSLAPERYRPRHAGDNVYKFSNVVTEDGDGYYRNVMLNWRDPANVIAGAGEPMTVITDPAVVAKVPNFIERMQYRDTLSYLPDDILTKVDRASMALALEVRVPILDHRVVEFAWRLPLHMKIDRGSTKRVLRQLLYRHVPRQLVDRPKTGFSVPVGSWLRGPMRSWAEDLLSERSLLQSGLFDPAPVRQRWNEHLSGRRNWQHALWSVLMFVAWQRRWA